MGNKTNSITPTERYVGHLIGPLGYAFLNFFLGSYLNVYYTDVCGLGSLWNGRFMSLYPIVVKAASVVTFLLCGWLIDRSHSRWGKARPWILVSVLLIPVSSFLLFLVPTGSETLTAVTVLGSNFLFYAVAATLYATANTLMVPLASDDPAQRSLLSVTTNAQVIISGSFIAMVVPMLLIPAIGVSKDSWMLVGAALSVLAAPLIFLQFAATKERVSHSEAVKKASPLVQLRACSKSKSWILLMVYFLLLNIVNSLSNAAIFYYCNWVLGSYQDGITQTVFYAIGNFPLGIGVFLCNPICRKLGRRIAMSGGLLLSAAGLLICVLFSRSLPLVLAGQFIKACGTIPSAYLASVLLGDALDDVQKKSGHRCDGFSSSIYNAMITVSSGLAFSILNGGMAALGYLTPTQSGIPTQPEMVQLFFVFCQMGIGLVVYPVLAWLLWKQQKT